MGNPFINAVYIGHPGWKAMGGRIGYSAAAGVSVILLCWFGVISVMLALVPSVAILPIPCCLSCRTWQPGPSRWSMGP
jgi:AGZA family xanthine/uracil permease-like MFS transporter